MGRPIYSPRVVLGSNFICALILGKILAGPGVDSNPGTGVDTF